MGSVYSPLTIPAGKIIHKKIIEMTQASSTLASTARRDIKQADGRSFDRIAVRTHMVLFGEDLSEVIAQYAQPHLTPNSIICLSEKFVTICQNNVRHISDVHDTWLARLIVKYVTKHRDDIGYSHPKKMQVAIELAGYPRIIAAVILGGASRLLLKRRGDFYRIAGNRISEIDGFNPAAMKPFDEYAMLPPLRPNETCDELAARFRCGCYIIDGNNINVEVIGMSRNMADLNVNLATARLLMLDNPMGQNDELTPIFVLREIKQETPASASINSAASKPEAVDTKINAKSADATEASRTSGAES